MTEIDWLTILLLITATIVTALCCVVAPRRTTGPAGTEDGTRIDMPSRGSFLSTLEPTSSLRNGAMIAVVGMLIGCAALSPFARTPLPVLSGLMPTTDTLFCVVYFVTGHILLGQFRSIRTYSILILAFGYFFQSWILGLRLLTFPGSFLVSADATAWVSTLWLYLAWHLSFPLFIIAYALQHGRRPRRKVGQKHIVAFATAAIIGLGGAVLAGLMLWSGQLPTIMIFDSPDGRFLLRFLASGLSPAIFLADLLAFWLVWRNSDSVLDVWLMVAVCAAGLDIAMTGIIGDRRFDLSFYAGRGFGILSALLTLVPLMTEMNRLYASLLYRQQDNEAKHRAIVDTAIDGIIVIDRFGCLQSLNPAALTMFGYTLEEAAGKSIRMLMPKKYHADHDRYLARYSETNVHESLEPGRQVEGLRKDGSTIDLELSVAEWFTAGEQQFTGIVRDNTERRQIERQLVQSQKMEAIGQLTGGLAHDFNNLLGIVINNIDLAIESYATPEAIPQEITGALNAAMTGADLVQRMLAFARRQPLQPKVTHLTRVVDEMLPLLRRTIGATIEINVACDAAVSPVLVDQAQFENAVLNLVLNSRAAMPDGGKILLEIRSQVIDADSADDYDVPAGQYTLVAVTDTGSGISKENLERVFEPFFTTKPVGLGSGLGLSMVFGYVRQSGGVIRIYSELARGTTIRIYLPKTHTDETPVEKAPPPDIATLRGNARILIVEDVEAARNLAQRIVSELGYTVQIAADALVALALLDAGERFDLLFTDIMMPEMDGEALAKIVRQRFPDIKILFASGFSLISSETIDTLKARYITKPYRKVELAQILKQMLTEKEPRRR